ncbi:glycosyltransferase [Rhodococcus rhodnii]|uniref:4,4'-diaponeurosporenoate glycosyltransferase n=2 Tax=Rhodococcus rhodnii TaxID=38312 RepID=R7WSU5_9NOCA|nr:glycosyltransferase [Rhodococcus rhodnii]EOM78341.1 putative glycosyl transferase [Rhodococcus rhodnii LMG 5362]TXG91179.1 glycosyltransferase [Rhodococcus rhodnii]
MTVQATTVRATRTEPDRVAVIVPVHNEAELLPRCIASLRRAAAPCPVPVTIVVVLDACDDGSNATVSPARDLLVVETSARNVGAARRAGFAAALSTGCSDTWLATTDADTVVPERWLAAQATHWGRCDALLGTVTVDWHTYGLDVRRRYDARYRAGTRGGRHTHVHGANLGVWADAYRDVGGFRPLRSGEDVDLVRRLRARGARVHSVVDNPVLTSDRVRGRAPAGFAGHLRTISQEVAAP